MFDCATDICKGVFRAKYERLRMQKSNRKQGNRNERVRQIGRVNKNRFCNKMQQIEKSCSKLIAKIEECDIITKQAKAEKQRLRTKRGDMAQLVERRVRNAKARGSNPLISTSQNLKRTPFERVTVLGFLFCVDILDCNLLSVNCGIALTHFDKVLKHGGLRS